MDREALETMKTLPSLCIYVQHNVFNWRNPPEDVNRASFVAPQAVSSQSDVRGMMQNTIHSYENIEAEENKNFKNTIAKNLHKAEIL